MFSTGDQILRVKIGGTKRIEQGEIASLPLIKAYYLSLRRTPCRNKLGPAVAFTGQQSTATERGLIALSIQPGKHFLKVQVYFQRFWLVQELQARTKAKF